MLIGLPTMVAAIGCVFAAGLLKKQESAAIAPAQILPDVYVADKYWVLDAVILQWAGYACGIIATAAFTYHFRSILKQRVLFCDRLHVAGVLRQHDSAEHESLFGASLAGVAGECRHPRRQVAGEIRRLPEHAAVRVQMFAGLFYGWLLTRTNPPRESWRRRLFF